MEIEFQGQAAWLIIKPGLQAVKIQIMKPICEHQHPQRQMMPPSKAMYISCTGKKMSPTNHQQCENSYLARKGPNILESIMLCVRFYYYYDFHKNWTQSAFSELNNSITIQISTVGEERNEAARGSKQENRYHNSPNMKWESQRGGKMLQFQWRKAEIWCCALFSVAFKTSSCTALLCITPSEREPKPEYCRSAERRSVIDLGGWPLQ